MPFCRVEDDYELVTTGGNHAWHWHCGVAHRLVLRWRLASSAVHLSRSLAAGRRSEGDCSHQSASILNLRRVCLRYCAARFPFCRERNQTGCRCVANRTAPLDSDERSIYETSPCLRRIV